MKNKARREGLVKVIRSTWASLETHLDSCVSETPQERKLCGNEQFHIKTVREYADTIKTLADQL
jgi:hypothetical protein